MRPPTRFCASRISGSCPSSSSSSAATRPAIPPPSTSTRFAPSPRSIGAIHTPIGAKNLVAQRPLESQQERLHLRPAAVVAEHAPGAQNAVTRDDDRDRVVAERG